MPAPVPAAAPSLDEVLTSLQHPGARRRFGVGPGGGRAIAGRRAADHDRVGPGGDHEARPTLAAWAASGGPAARTAADPVAALDIVELSGALSFHGPAAAVVDLVVSALVVRGVVLAVGPADVTLGFEGPNVVEALVAPAIAPSAAGADGPARCAAALVAALDPLVDVVVPHDPELRWGAVADLAVVLAAGRARAHALDDDATWATALELVEHLRHARPHPVDPPVRLAVPVGEGEPPLALARRCSCCQWHRAARHLGEASVADARCADCPSLDPAANVARLAALARRGDLVLP